jgi:hypothetical protein
MHNDNARRKGNTQRHRSCGKGRSRNLRQSDALTTARSKTGRQIGISHGGPGYAATASHAPLICLPTKPTIHAIFRSVWSEHGQARQALSKKAVFQRQRPTAQFSRPPNLWRIRNEVEPVYPEIPSDLSSCIVHFPRSGTKWQKPR